MVGFFVGWIYSRRLFRVRCLSWLPVPGIFIVPTFGLWKSKFKCYIKSCASLILYDNGGEKTESVDFFFWPGAVAGLTKTLVWFAAYFFSHQSLSLPYLFSPFFYLPQLFCHLCTWLNNPQMTGIVDGVYSPNHLLAWSTNFPFSLYLTLPLPTPTPTPFPPPSFSIFSPGCEKADHLTFSNIKCNARLWNWFNLFYLFVNRITEFQNRPWIIHLSQSLPCHW